MTRTPLQLIADVVSAHAAESRDQLAHAFARELGRENPRFDVRRFLAACGVKP